MRRIIVSVGLIGILVLGLTFGIRHFRRAESFPSIPSVPLPSPNAYDYYDKAGKALVDDTTTGGMLSPGRYRRRDRSILTATTTLTQTS